MMQGRGRLARIGDAAPGTHVHSAYLTPPLPSKLPPSPPHPSSRPHSMDDTMLTRSADCLDERPDTLRAKLKATTGSVGRTIGKLLHRSLRSSSSGPRRKSFPLETRELGGCWRSAAMCLFLKDVLCGVLR